MSNRPSRSEAKKLMRPKGATAIIFIVGLSIGVFFTFAYFDAKAFQHESESLVDIARRNCENEKKYVAETTAEIYAEKAELSQQLAEAENPTTEEREEVDEQIAELDQSLSEFRAQEAKACGPDIQAAIAAQAKADRDYYKGLITYCQALKKNYKGDVKNAKAKGLSGIYSKEDIAQMVRDIKNEQKHICGLAKKARAALKKFK